MKTKNNELKHKTSLHFWTLLLIPVILLTIINCNKKKIDELTAENNKLKSQLSSIPPPTMTGTTVTITGGTTTIMNLQNQLNALSGAPEQIANLQNQLSTLSGANAEQIMTLQNELNYLNRHKYVYNYDINVDANIYAVIWSNGETMYINGVSNDILFAYNTTTTSGIKMRVESKDFNINTEELISVLSMYLDGTTLWGAALGDLKYKAFTFSTGERDMGKDFSLDSENSAARGSLWSDGTTLWVSDINDDKIYAYDMVTKARKPREDFNTLSGAGNTSPGKPLVRWGDDVGSKC